jgi:tRNA(His) guanylyltransferase
MLSLLKLNISKAKHSNIAHINNLYNTTFWALVQKGNLSTTEAHKELSVGTTSLMNQMYRLIAFQGTISSQKNEILFSRFGINYSKEPEMFKKGSLLLWEEIFERDADQDEPEVKGPIDDDTAPEPDEQKKKSKNKVQTVQRRVICVHEDLVKEKWWKEGRGKDLFR